MWHRVDLIRTDVLEECVASIPNSTAFSPQVNYTDWATAIDQRILVPTFEDRGVSRSQRGGTLTAVNLSFLDGSRYFFFQVAPHLSSRILVDPVPDTLLLRKCGRAGNGTRDLCVCNQELWLLDHRESRLHYQDEKNQRARDNVSKI
jgi:hypothetical protein